MHCGFLQVCRLLHCLHGQRWKRHEMCAKALALKSPLPVLHGERVRARGSSRHRRCIRVPPHNKGERTAANSPPPCGEGLGVGVRRQALCVGTTATPSAAPDDCLHALPANFANSPPGPPPHPQTPPREGEGRRIVRRAAARSLWECGHELQIPSGEGRDPHAPSRTAFAPTPVHTAVSKTTPFSLDAILWVSETFAGLLSMRALE